MYLSDIAGGIEVPTYVETRAITQDHTLGNELLSTFFSHYQHQNSTLSQDNQQLFITQLCPQAQEILGDKGMKRFEMFCREKEGWYVGNTGKPLSLIAVKYFNRFCSFIEKISAPVSIFMGLEGSLEIMWRTTSNQMFNVEFFDNRIEYYFEKTDDEGVVSPSDIHSLVITILSLQPK